MEFKLPDIGEGVAEGEITKWLVKEGDNVKEDQPIVEVMTDKATVELPSPASGTISKIVVKEGETVAVGTVIVKIESAGSAAQSKPQPDPKKEEPAKRAEPVRAERKASESAQPQKAAADNVVPFKVLATPATRKLARDLHIDLGGVKGTGLHGRVTKTDVQMVYETQQAATPRTSHPAIATSVAKEISIPAGEITKIPLRGIRKKIATAMAHSKQTAAHFTYVEEVDMTEVVKLRESVKEEAKKRNLKITYLPFIIKALIPALKDFPFMNSSLDDASQEILLKAFYNIGIATDTANGLMVPVIHDADHKNIWELAGDIETLSEKTRSGKISVEELKGGTFTITNAGSLGGVFATPVINHPEVAILGVNAIRRRPVVSPDSDEIVVRHMMFLSLSVDHRVVDGADAARFMNQLVFYLSDPKRLIFA